MHRFNRGMLLAFAAAAVPSGALGMTVHPTESAGPCRVIGGEKLPPETGGAKGICTAIERAINERAPNVRYSAEVRVLSTSSLAVDVVADGHKLPEQKLAVMDRNLNSGSLERFARALAELIAKTRGV